MSKRKKILDKLTAEAQEMGIYETLYEEYWDSLPKEDPETRRVEDEKLKLLIDGIDITRKDENGNLMITDEDLAIYIKVSDSIEEIKRLYRKKRKWYVRLVEILFGWAILIVISFPIYLVLNHFLELWLGA